MRLATGKSVPCEGTDFFVNDRIGRNCPMNQNPLINLWRSCQIRRWHRSRCEEWSHAHPSRLHRAAVSGQKLLFLRPRRGNARQPIAVLSVSALGSGSLATRTTRGEGLARSPGRPSSVRGVVPKLVIFYLPTTLKSIITCKEIVCQVLFARVGPVPRRRRQGLCRFCALETHL